MNNKTLLQLIIGLLAAAAVVVLAIFVVVPMFSGEDQPGSDDGLADSSADSTSDENAGPSDEEVREALLSVAKRDPLDRLAMGPVDAPVVMSVFSDYRCPYCTMFSREALPEIVQEFVESGQVRLEWRDSPFQGDESVMAAMAAHAAALQNKYWEYNQALVDAGSTSSHASFSVGQLVELAKNVGVPDLELFEEDMRSDAVLELVKADYDLAQNLGVQSTPTIIIGGDAVIGAASFDTFKQVIEQEIKLAEQ